MQELGLESTSAPLLKFGKMNLIYGKLSWMTFNWFNIFFNSIAVWLCSHKTQRKHSFRWPAFTRPYPPKYHIMLRVCMNRSKLLFLWPPLNIVKFSTHFFHNENLVGFNHITPTHNYSKQSFVLSYNSKLQSNFKFHFPPPSFTCLHNKNLLPVLRSHRSVKSLNSLIINYYNICYGYNPLQ